MAKKPIKKRLIKQRKKWHDDPKVKDRGGIYFPNSEPRHIPEGATIHNSVWDRVDEGNYAPENLPDRPSNQE